MIHYNIYKIGQYFNDNPNAQLREILDQEDLLESKQNIKLFGELNSVTKSPERFWEMLQIINLMPKENEEVIPYKYNLIVISRYPFLVSEIIGSKEELIINYFFDQKGPEEFEFLNMLFKTIDRDFIDNTLAGYVAKILKALIEKRGISLWKYLLNSQKESQYVFKDLIKLLDVPQIAEIIYNLIRLDIIKDEGEEVYIDQRLQLLTRIIDYLQSKSYNGVIVENVSYILQNILTETIDDDERAQFINTILSSSLRYDSIYISKSSSMIKILIIILEYIQRDIQAGENKIFINYLLIQEVGINLVDLLNLDLNLTPFPTSYGANQEPLGQFKLQLVELYLKIVKMNDSQIIPYIQHQNVCFAIMQLILKHQFNNAIQNLFLELIQLVMKNDAYQQIQEAYNAANLMGFFIFLNQQEKYQVGSIKKQITKGYQGMANKLSYILKGDFQDENWTAYLQNHQQIFQNENTYLLGQNPNSYENEEQEEALMQSIKFTSDNNIIKQTEVVEQNNNQQQQQQQQQQQPQQQQQIIQQQIPSIQFQESDQKNIIIQQQEMKVQQDNSTIVSSQKFGEIDNIFQDQEEIKNQNDVNAKIEEVLERDEYKNPDAADRVLNDHVKTKAKNEKNSKSGELEINKCDSRLKRRGTVSYSEKPPKPEKPSSPKKRNSFDQNDKNNEHLTPKNKLCQNQTFSPQQQLQSWDKNK
ncbi:unnamed protein product (macronuclear) [Paramecium tetraurelia]|uniref:Serine/threonine-protein phosphatase 4 regulatory subunit 3-like central domain-containing protein n=1 Tax=Paramecium tetraurelia TaxID=5888 RepID=A0BL15_PARTE|nr:uncharacterized protein GSPATT00029863001 [Paramecium tetraurelia]CAK59232.1 unnamed protein product [Paramecium tetraurelia]|eukprot:XP_001426630.1 hypothetical protein (macronuclear) [Paramecium tetraurelia strain d4-2]